ncbi:SDR family oxidoreductase [Vibrio diabolicus]|uniref:UDP-glucose 4-epimerase family protein n=1 Tax=Vibrio harveyi group TaxID=717610 RepID=UPI001EEC3F6C|nr:SDR family oxidoreductase [Vibrio alginolyticus]MCG6325585.1 SDR family oxidoreductase [Vibrio alginolyticus]
MILVTGANGFLGSHLIKRLSDRSLMLLDRGISKYSSEYRFTQAEVGPVTDFSYALQGCDTVVHCAARVHVMDDLHDSPLEAYREVNTAGTINLVKQAVEAGVKRFIFISSIKVNGESSQLGKPFTKDDPHSFEDDYGQSKSEAEIALHELAKETGLELVIIRPTLVYGAGVKANFASLLNLVSKGIPLPFGCVTNNRRSLVSVTNLVDLIVTCIDNPSAANQTFLVSDDHDVSTSEIVSQMSKALGKPQVQLPVPEWGYKMVGKLFGKQDVVDRLLGSLQVDIKHTKETLNWTPPQTLEAGFQEAAQAFLQSKQK